LRVRWPGRHQAIIDQVDAHVDAASAIGLDAADQSPRPGDHPDGAIECAPPAPSKPSYRWRPSLASDVRAKNMKKFLQHRPWWRLPVGEQRQVKITPAAGRDDRQGQGRRRSEERSPAARKPGAPPTLAEAGVDKNPCLPCPRRRSVQAPNLVPNFSSGFLGWTRSTPAEMPTGPNCTSRRR
jgi:hypothetical protein